MSKFKWQINPSTEGQIQKIDGIKIIQEGCRVIPTYRRETRLPRLNCFAIYYVVEMEGIAPSSALFLPNLLQA